MLAIFAVAMVTGSVARAQPPAAGPTQGGGDIVMDLAAGPGADPGDDLFALDPAEGEVGSPAAAGGGFIMARRPGMGGGPGLRRGPEMGPWRAELARALKLTDAQKEKLGDLRERQLRKGIQARADLALARLDLRKLLRGERPNLTAVDAQIDRIARLRADLAKSRIATLLEMRSLLTPEQQRLLRERREMMGPRGRGDDGGGLGSGRGMIHEGEPQ
jgi:Spy/CpxP family protein refolding chaperone